MSEQKEASVTISVPYLNPPYEGAEISYCITSTTNPKTIENENLVYMVNVWIAAGMAQWDLIAYARHPVDKSRCVLKCIYDRPIRTWGGWK